MAKLQNKPKSTELAGLQWLGLPFLASDFKREAEIAYLNARQELQWFSQVPKSQPPTIKTARAGTSRYGRQTPVWRH